MIGLVCEKLFGHIWVTLLWDEAEGLITKFLDNRKEVQTKGEVATDQLLNAVYLLARDQAPEGTDRDRLQESLLKHLSSVFDT